MKSKTSLWCLVMVALLLVPACQKKAPGQLGGEGMLGLVPEGAMMLMGFDFQKFASLELFDKTLKENWQKNPKAGKVFKDYPDFVQQTGVDLQKDVYNIVVAVYGSIDEKNPDIAGLVNLKYDPDKLLAVLSKNKEIAAEETYRGRTLYTLKDKGEEKDKEMRLAFLNKQVIAFGSLPSLKKVVDLEMKEGQSVLKTAALMKYVGKLDKKKMFWLAVGNIPEKMKRQPQGGMMPVDLSKAEAFTAVVDFKGKVLSGELRLISMDEQGNKQIADMLNGLKSLGAMGASKEPELAQLLNGIQLGSAADHVHLTFSFPEELLQKLSAKSKAKGMMPPAAPEPFGQ